VDLDRHRCSGRDCSHPHHRGGDGLEAAPRPPARALRSRVRPDGGFGRPSPSGGRELRDREARHDRLDLHPLAPAARDRYQEQWASLQSEFVDHPQVAVAEADSLVANVMRDRGYPVEKFDANADLLSVEHGQVVDDYRKGHALYVKTVEGSASTEDLRQAVVSYRSLFEELIREDGADQPAEPPARPSA
jgi:hypothetical protein